MKKPPRGGFFVLWPLLIRFNFMRPPGLFVDPLTLFEDSMRYISVHESEGCSIEVICIHG